MDVYFLSEDQGYHDKALASTTGSPYELQWIHRASDIETITDILSKY